MNLDHELIEHDQYSEIQLSGNPLSELDFQSLHDTINDLVKTGKSNVILNLREIELLNSLGLNALIKIMTKCRNEGGDLYIVNISEKINQVLLLTKLNTVLNIAGSADEAAENLLNSN